MIENMKQVDRENRRDPLFGVFLSMIAKEVEDLAEIVVSMLENDEANISETISNHYSELDDKINEFCEKHYWSKGIENAYLEPYYTSIFGAYWNSDFGYDNFDPKVMIKVANDEKEHPARRKACELIFQRMKENGEIPEEEE